MGRQLEQFQKCTVASFLQNNLLHGWLIKGWKKSLLANECEQLKANLESISIISLFFLYKNPPQAESSSLLCHRSCQLVTLPWDRTWLVVRSNQAKKKNNDSEPLIGETLLPICSPGMPHYLDASYNCHN